MSCCETRLVDVWLSTHLEGYTDHQLTAGLPLLSYNSCFTRSEDKRLDLLCGPITLHLNQINRKTLTTSCPLLLHTHSWLSCSMFAAIIHSVKKTVMGSRALAFVLAATAALVNCTACCRLIWWAVRCQDNKVICLSSVQQIHVFGTDILQKLWEADSFYSFQIEKFFNYRIFTFLPSGWQVFKIFSCGFQCFCLWLQISRSITPDNIKMTRELERDGTK